VKVHQDASNPVGGQQNQAIGRTKGGLNAKTATAFGRNYGNVEAGLAYHLGAIGFGHPVGIVVISQTAQSRKMRRGVTFRLRLRHERAVQ
jgi:hypothetical protein